MRVSINWGYRKMNGLQWKILLKMNFLGVPLGVDTVLIPTRWETKELYIFIYIYTYIYIHIYVYLNVPINRGTPKGMAYSGKSFDQLVIWGYH